jgi:hemoglobin
MTPFPRVGPGVAASVTESMIHDLVHGFYAEVRMDPLLGPIFDRAIGGAWDEHLNKLCDFWSSVLLMTGRFKGAPMTVHVGIPDIGAPHFQRWLDIFEQVALEVCPPDAAALFVGKSRMIAQSLQLGIAVQRDDPPGSDFLNT